MRRASRGRAGAKVAIAGGLLAGALLPLSQAGATPRPAPVVHPPTFTTVSSGLNNPRGLAFGPGGQLYVAQAGLGDGNPAEAGVGHTGAVSVIDHPDAKNPSTKLVLKGLVSLAAQENPPPAPPDIVGADGLSVKGSTIYVAMAQSNSGTTLSDPQIGRIIKINRNGSTDIAGDPGNFDFQWTGAHADLVKGQFPDANPYGILALGGKIYVTDAGANTLDEVGPGGSVAVDAFFPNLKVSDAVPTCVAKGPDGALYVGTLSIADFVVSGGQPVATVYRVDPAKVMPYDGSTYKTVATVWATGLDPITGCTFGPDGSFYATEFVTHVITPPHAPPTVKVPVGGDLVRIPWAAHPSPASYQRIGDGTLMNPGTVAVSPWGDVYVSNKSTDPFHGEVVRVER